MSTFKFPNEFNKTHRQNLKLEESKEEKEINQMMRLLDTESRRHLQSDDKFIRSIGIGTEREAMFNFNSKRSGISINQNKETQTILALYENPIPEDESSMLMYPPLASSMKPYGAQVDERLLKIDFVDKQTQVDPEVFNKRDLEILGKRLQSSETKFSKIFILIDEIAHKLPDLSKFWLEIRRELEVEIGALELEKSEMAAKRKKLHEKAEALTDIEIKNLENSVYLENKIQECNIRIAELTKWDVSKTVEVWNADVQTMLTCDRLKETEVELITTKQNLEIDLLTLNQRIKAKEKEFRFDYGKQLDWVNQHLLLTFNIESHRKEIELLRQEVANENKCLVAKKKQLLLSPFSELKSDAKLRDLIYHFKKASIQDVKAPDIDIEFEAYLRREMFQISTLEDIDKLRNTCERVVKLEYILLREKSKMHLVNQYVDAAINELESEKEEYRIMRQKYENLLSMEKDLHKHKQEHEEKTNKFQHLLQEFKEKILKVFDNFQEIMQIKKGKDKSLV